MGIKVCVRLCGASLTITLPSQVPKLHSITKGDMMEISPISK